jgi:hypothetical protein
MYELKSWLKELLTVQLFKFKGLEQGYNTSQMSVPTSF